MSPERQCTLSDGRSEDGSFYSVAAAKTAETASILSPLYKLEVTGYISNSAQGQVMESPCIGVRQPPHLLQPNKRQPTEPGV